MSLVEQYTIQCEYLAYFLPKKPSKKLQKTIFIKGILCNFLVWTLYFFYKNLTFLFAHKNMKKSTSKFAHDQPKSFFFHYSQLAQNQPKYHILFHNNGSLRNTHCLYRFLDNQKNTRSQFSFPGLREIHRNLKQKKIQFSRVLF